MKDLVDIINNVGFPIFAVIVLFWQNSQMRTMFDNEQKELQKALQENTLALSKLSVTLDDTLGNRKEDENNEPTTKQA